MKSVMLRTPIESGMYPYALGHGIICLFSDPRYPQKRSSTTARSSLSFFCMIKSIGDM
jgi:hypothetical protein